MSTSQRSKRGCWTCRLRRKKCSEDGPPCSKCDGRGILCHGYGPKPDWKDRGDKEKEEAKKLQIQSRRSRTMSTSSIGDITVSSANDICSGSIPTTQTDIRLAFPQSQDITTFDSVGESQPALAPPGPSLFMDDFWADRISHETFDDLATPLSPTYNGNLDMALMGFLTPKIPSHLGIDTSETDIRLLINFMEDSFSRQYTLNRGPLALQKSWLLYLMLRSPTFYNTSLSMSAYYLYLSESNNTSARELALRNYHKYREMAIRGFDGLDSTLPSIHGGVVICGIHIALLEALGKNMRSCQSYLRRVGQNFIENGYLLYTNLVGQRRKSAASLTTSNVLPPTADMSPRVGMLQHSPLELEAAVFFAAKFVWNDVLCSAVEKKIPCAPDTHRKLLTDDKFSSVFKDITGCETWIMTAIMDVSALEIKKGDQLAQGNLSIRELASQADNIERVVEREMERLSNSIGLPQQSHGEQPDKTSPHHLIQTFIFGYAVLIHLNTVVSGALTGVPEIHQNISRAILAWEMLPSTTSPRYLAWAYSTSASLATGSQRDVFKNAVVHMSQLDANLGSLRESIHGVEECWRETDKHSSDHCNIPRDWREIHKRANLNILFV